MSEVERCRLELAAAESSTESPDGSEARETQLHVLRQRHHLAGDEVAVLQQTIDQEQSELHVTRKKVQQQHEELRNSESHTL